MEETPCFMPLNLNGEMIVSTDNVKTPTTIETYSGRVIAGHPENFTSVEYSGVRGLAGGVVKVDNENPQFYTAYLRHRDGRAIAVADAANEQEIIDYCGLLIEDYEDAYGWKYTGKA
jgi:hypothetical protein